MEALTLQLQFELEKLIARTFPNQRQQLECFITKLLKQELTVPGFQQEICHLFGFGGTPFDPVWLELELVKSLVHLQIHFGKRMSVKGWHGPVEQDQVVPVLVVPLRVVGTSAGR